MATQWLSDAEQTSWRNFIMTVHDLIGALEADLAVHQISFGDYEVLVWLSEAADSRMRMCDLAAAMQLSPSGLTRRLDGLVRRGWIERATSPTDRRVMFAVLTDTGRAKMAKVAPDHVDSVRRHVIEPMGAKGLAQVGEAFARVHRHLRELDE